MNYKTRDQFAALTRDEMYQELLSADPTSARGKSRAKKDELTKLYFKAELVDKKLAAEEAATMPPSDSDHHSLSIEPPKLDPMQTELTHKREAEPFNFGDDVKQAMRPQPVPVIIETEAGEAVPYDNAVEAVKAVLSESEPEKMVPVDPPMPSLSMVDGEILNLPPRAEDRMFTFHGGVERELTEKEQYLLGKAEKAFKAFCDNPADTRAKKDFEGLSYRLRGLGVILNPRHHSTLKEGRDYVRDFRRKSKLGVDLTPGTSSKTAEA